MSSANLYASFHELQSKRDESSASQPIRKVSANFDPDQFGESQNIARLLREFQNIARLLRESRRVSETLRDSERIVQNLKASEASLQNTRTCVRGFEVRRGSFSFSDFQRESETP